MARTNFASRVPAGAAMRSLVDGADQASAEPVVAPASQRPLEVGAADDRAELQADAVAEQVLGRIGAQERHSHGPGCGHGDAVRRTPTAAPTATIGAAGGALDDASSGEIEAARGGGAPLDAGVRREMEGGFGHSLGDVRIHTDANADKLSGQMSARAFTTGRDIFFGKGEYDPSSASGKRTLAHELAHTVQDGGTTRRKMRGTAEALANQGEGETSGKFRKAIGWLTNWDKIVTSVRKYESEEDKLLGSGANPNQMALATAKPGMLKLLKKAQEAIKDWKKSNDHETETAKGEQKVKKSKEDSADVADTRAKAGRRQAVAMVEPRVGNEVTLLSSKDSAGWLSSLGLSAKQVTTAGASKSGQMNTVSQLNYKTESGSFSGYFKEDKGLNKGLLDHEDEAGITHTDPNYGARSVALYRLDQLFDARVTARAEFAVHTNKQGKSVMGTVLEAAKGKEGGDLAFRLQGDLPGGGTVSLDDPVLQRGLNKLQILDAISGQLDRHMGNYYVDSDDEGNVRGVTGIDLDMAFGSKMKSTAGPAGAHNYKGLPEFIDKEMGDKILTIKPADIRAALLGLLPKAEIESTVSRFTEVHDKVAAAKKAGKLVDKWDPNTAKEGSKAGAEYTDAKTYHAQARDVWYSGVSKLANQKLKESLARGFTTVPGWSEMPEKMYTNISKAARVDTMWKEKSQSVLVKVVVDYLFEAHLSEAFVPELIDLVVVSVLGNLDENKLAIQLQECGTAMDEAKLRTTIQQQMEAHVAKNAKSFQSKFAGITGKR